MSAAPPDLPGALSVDSLAKFYQSNLITPANGVIEGPYGETRYVYADWTASGQSLRCIEDQINKIVLPYYANTHTEASFSGQQMSLYRKHQDWKVTYPC
jgi:selenocysteine lyase/cysteine desulfurase